MKSLSGRTETLMLEKRGRLVRSRWVSLPGDTISNSKGLLSRQCLASDSIRSPARSKSPRRWILRKARGRMAWRTSENIVLVVSENTCGVWSLPHQLTEDGYHRPTSVRTSHGARAADRPLTRSKKTPGQEARRVKQGGFTSGRRGIMRIPSFERDQPKPLVSKT